MNSGNSLQDLYVSAWVRLGPDAFNKTLGGNRVNVVRCANTQSSTQFGFEMVMSRNRETMQFGLRASVQSIMLTAQIDKVQQLVDLSGWNHLAMHVDTARTLRLSLNSAITTQTSLGSGNALFYIGQNSAECVLGGGEFQALNIRHVIFAEGMLKTILSYSNMYAHSVPAPLDPYVFSFAALEDHEQVSDNFVINEAEIQRRNEPETVCRCQGSDSDTDTPNYPKIGHSSSMYFENIPRIPFPMTKNETDFRVSFSFVIMPQSISDGDSSKPFEIIGHKSFWSFGLFNRSQLFLDLIGVPQQLRFDVRNAPGQLKQGKLLYQDNWMNYSFTFNTTNVQLRVEDFTSKNPVIFNLDYSLTPLNLTEIFNPNDTVPDLDDFRIRPQSMSAILSRMIYKYGEEVVFDFKMSQDHFLYTNHPFEAITTKNFLVRSHIGQFVSGSQVLKTSSYGVQFVQIRPPCNYQDPKYSWDGLVCRDQKKYLYFNQAQSKTTRAESYLRGVTSQFTFEVWFMFDGYVPDNYQTQASLLSVYMMDAIHSQIFVTTGNDVDAFSIKCDPNPKEPRIQGMMNPVSINNLVKKGKWMHFSCTSDQSQKMLRSYLFDSPSQNTFNSQQSDSYMISIPSSLSALSVFGNNRDGSQPFRGYLREVRFWNVVKSERDIVLMRYQSIPLESPLRSALIIYMMLNAESGNQHSEVDLSNQMSSTHLYEATIPNTWSTSSFQALSPMSWLPFSAPSPLTICPSSTIFNMATLCCTDSSFYARIQKTMVVGDEDGKQHVQLQLIIIENVTNSGAANLAYYNYKWSIGEVLNFQGTQVEKTQHISTMQSFISQIPLDQELKVLIPQDLLQFNASYIFNVRLESLIRNYNKVYETSILVKPECPQISLRLKISNIVPLKVSSKMNPSLLKIDLVIRDGCIDPQIINLGLEWTVSTPTTSYNISSDQKTIQFREFPSNTQNIYISAKLLFRQLNEPQAPTEKVSDTLKIQLVDQPLSLITDKESYKIDQAKGDIIIDFQSSLVNVNYPISFADQKVEYQVDCPSYLFSTTTRQRLACNPDPLTGFLKIPLSLTQVANYQTYNFTLTMKSDVLGYQEVKQVSYSFFTERYEYCPRLSFDAATSYTREKEQQYLIRPFVFLDCQMRANDLSSPIERFQISNIRWEVEGYSNPNEFLDVYGLVSVVRRAHIGDEILQPYFGKNITLRATLSNGTQLVATTRFTMLRTPLSISLISSHPTGVVPFNETMILDASQTVDRDYLNAQLSFYWSFKNGELKQAETSKLVLTPFDRISMGLTKLQQPQKIDISALNSLKPDGQGQITTWMNFSPFRAGSQYILPKQCAIQLNNGQNMYFFTVQNFTDVWLSADVNTTNCVLGADLIKMDGRLYTFVPDTLLEDPSKNNFELSTSLQIKQEALRTKLQPNQFIEVNFIYLISYIKKGGLETFYDYLVYPVRIIRIPAPLQVLFNGLPANLSLEVGQESSLTLDAGLSLDLDRPLVPLASNFTYLWICDPIICSSIRSTQVLTKAMREDNGLNKIGDKILIGVEARFQGKESAIQYVEVRVVKQDYSKCIKVRLSNAIGDEVRISKRQEFPIVISLQPEYICAQVSLRTAQWSSLSGIEPFWQNSKGTFITLQKNNSLPSSLKEILMQVKVSYAVTTSSDIVLQTTTYPFKITLTSSEIDVVVKSNVSGDIFDLQDQNSMILNANESRDPENVTDKMSCAWQYNNGNQTVQVANDSCILEVYPQDVTFSKNSSLSEIKEFRVTVSTSNGQKSNTKSIFITLLSLMLPDILPHCSIKNANSKTSFDIDSQMLFHPACAPSSRNTRYLADYSFQWILNPPIAGMLLNNFRLDIPKQHLYGNLADNQAGQLEIILRVFWKNNTNVQYFVKRTYEIPKFFDGPPPLSKQIPSIQIFPPIATTLVNGVKISIGNFDLVGNQYFRLRARKTFGDNEILISRFKNFNVTVYLPQQTSEVYLEVIDGQRLDLPDYSIYSMKLDGLVIQEVSGMSMNQFNLQFLPRIEYQAPAGLVDVTDQAMVTKTLKDVLSLKKIVSSIKSDAKPRFNSMLYSGQVSYLYDKVFRAESQIYWMFNIHNRVQTKALFAEIIVRMFVEGCGVQEYKDEAENYLTAILRDLINPESITEAGNEAIDVDCKNSYLSMIMLLAKSSCISALDKALHAVYFDQIFFRSILEGEFIQYSSLMEPGHQVAVYKMSQLDRNANNKLIYTSVDQSVTLSLYTGYMPEDVDIVSVRTAANQIDIQKIEQLNTNFWYKASQSFLEIGLHYSNFTRRPADLLFPEPVLEMRFSLQTPFLEANRRKNKTTMRTDYRCQSRMNENMHFEVGKIDPYLNTVIFNDDNVVCSSQHLWTQFALAYYLENITSPAVEIKSPKFVVVEQSIFEEIPLLIYLLPALLAVIILVFAVFGLLMHQTELNRPQRLYNLLSLGENLDKYTLIRLFGCLILQFNPLFNYVFKANPYMSRPIRLLILTDYFLIISSLCLLYYVYLPDGVRLADIFWFGFLLMALILVSRPATQDAVFSMFYPQNLSSWKEQKSTRYRMGSANSRQRRPRSSKSAKMRGARRQRDGLQHSEEQVDMGEIIYLDQEDTEQNNSPQRENHKGRYSASKKYMRTQIEENLPDIVGPNEEIDAGQETGNRLFQQQNQLTKGQDKMGKTQQINKERDSTSKNQVQSSKKNKGKAADEIEMQDLSQIRNQTPMVLRVQNDQERNSRDLLRISQNSVHQYQQSKDYADFKIDSQQDGQVHIDLDKIDASVLDIDTSQIGLNKDSSKSQIDEYGDEYMEKEGGEEEGESQASSQKADEVSSPDPLRGQSRIPQMRARPVSPDGKVEGKRKSKNYSGQDITSAEIGFQERGNDSQGIQNDQDCEEESTPALDSIYKNYRQLRIQQTSGVKRFFGVLLFFFLLVALLGLHVGLMWDMGETQFTNWVSCTVFTFTVMIFGVDSLLYFIVAVALKRTKGKQELRRCWSIMNIFVFMPLGKLKFMELELELAKLKDLDKEYAVLEFN